MKDCRICNTPCVGEYRQKLNAGVSAWCPMEAVDYRRKLMIKAYDMQAEEDMCLVSDVREAEAEIKKLKDGIQKALDYTNPMSSPFTVWYLNIREILTEALKDAK